DIEDRDRLDRAILAAQAEQSKEEKATAMAPPTALSEPTPATADAPQLAAMGWPSTPQMIVGVYCTFSAGLLIWWLVGLMRLVRLCRTTTPAPEQVVALYRHIAGKAGEGVRLLCSDRIDLPLTFSWRRPVIVLPRSLCQESEEAALRFCLAH